MQDSPELTGTELSDLTKLEAKIAEYEATISLCIPSRKDFDLEEYLSMGREQLEKLTWQQVEEIRVDVLAYLCYLQKEQNRRKMRIGWLESTLRLVTSDAIQENVYGGYLLQEKTLYAIRYGDLALRIEQQRIKEQAVYDSGSFIIPRLDNWLDGLKSLAYSKSKTYS